MSKYPEIDAVLAGESDGCIVCGDCLEVMLSMPSGSVPIIITDPPYPLEFIECWSSLSKGASNVLVDGGLCFAYSGQTHLPEVHRRMGEHLGYCWQFVLLHTGAHQAIHHRHVMCGHKPVLMYSKGKAEYPDNGYFSDIIGGAGRSKGTHPWEQACGELYQMIDHYTEPGDVILEPFCGSGTTCEAAKRTGRRWIGIEITEEYFNKSTAKLQNTERPLFT